MTDNNDARCLSLGEAYALYIDDPTRSSPAIFGEIRANARLLPGQAAIPWRKAITEQEAAIRKWAEGLVPYSNEEIVGEVGVTTDEADDSDLADIERKLLNRKPAVRERISKSIERGNVGARLKRANGFRCQICDALGLEALGFLKSNGKPYVEAHHAIPVSALEVGSVSATNIMIVCANHHRQMRYGSISVRRTPTEFVIGLDNQKISIPRFGQSIG